MALTYSRLFLASEYYRTAFIVPNTKATPSLDQAIQSFNCRDWTHSANCFLKGWCILQEEYKRALPLGEKQTAENTARMILGLTALHDMAKACFCNSGDYKSPNGKLKLQAADAPDGLGLRLAKSNSFRDAGLTLIEIYTRCCLSEAAKASMNEQVFLHGTINWMTLYLEDVKAAAMKEAESRIAALEEIAEYPESQDLFGWVR
jgi:hypothetical protein